MSSLRYHVPYLRLFPIWKYGPRYDPIDGRHIDDGWYPENYGDYAFRTREEARAACERLHDQAIAEAVHETAHDPAASESQTG